MQHATFAEGHFCKNGLVQISRLGRHRRSNPVGWKATGGTAHALYLRTCKVIIQWPDQF